VIDETRGSGWSPPGWLIPVLGVLVVVLLAGVLTLVVLVGSRDSKDSGRDSGLEAARQVAADFSTYDYTKADVQFQHLLAISTGDMRKQVQQSITSFVPLIKQGKAKATGQVRDAAVVAARGNVVQVIAVVDQTGTNTVVTKPALHRYRFFLVMTKVHGDWLVSKLEQA
jgi:Mce-associated membrane protein